MGMKRFDEQEHPRGAGGKFAVKDSDSPGQVDLRGPIRRRRMTPTNRNLNWLFDKGSTDLDMDQPYQRPRVWGVQRQRLLIRSLLEGIPIPALIVNNRLDGGFHEPGYSDDRNCAYAIVDGKQRSTALLAFRRDELSIPSAWLEPAWVETSESDVRWSGLTRPGQRHFENLPLAVVEAQCSTLAQEREIFDRVNFGGVAQGDTDADVYDIGAQNARRWKGTLDALA